MTFQELVFQHTIQFNESDQEIAVFIFDHPSCFEWSISKFSREALVSKTSVVRFCQKVGLSGFSQLKALLKWEQQKVVLDEGLLELVKSNYEKMLHTILHTDMSMIFKDILQANRIILYGSGVRQSRVVNEWKRIFLPTGKTMITINDEELLDCFPHVIEKNDFVVIVSLSGEREKVIDISKYLKIMNIPTLCLTRMQQNRLAQVCKHALYINSISIDKAYAIEYEIVTPYYMLVEMIYIMYQQYVHNSK